MKKLSSTSFRFTPDSGSSGDVYCGVCSEKMNCKKNLYGPRGMTEALSGHKSYYDEFLCKFSEEKWHEQVVSLRKEADKTSSFKLRTMLLAEAQEILLTKIPTIL